MSIYVGNLSYEVIQSDIRNDLIDALDGAEWMRRALKVSKAKQREERSQAGSQSGNRDYSRRY